MIWVLLMVNLDSVELQYLNIYNVKYVEDFLFSLE